MSIKQCIMTRLCALPLLPQDCPLATISPDYGAKQCTKCEWVCRQRNAASTAADADWLGCSVDELAYCSRPRPASLSLLPSIKLIPVVLN